MAALKSGAYDYLIKPLDLDVLRLTLERALDHMSSIKKVVLAYSGGLDTSVILKWIKKTYGCEVVTVTCDLGQEEELDGLEDKALHTGAAKAYIDDLREEFAKDFIFPML